MDKERSETVLIAACGLVGYVFVIFMCVGVMGEGSASCFYVSWSYGGGACLRVFMCLEVMREGDDVYGVI